MNSAVTRASSNKAITNPRPEGTGEGCLLDGKGESGVEKASLRGALTFG